MYLIWLVTDERVFPQYYVVQDVLFLGSEGSLKTVGTSMRLQSNTAVQRLRMFKHCND